MAVTDYLQKTSGTCRYSYSKLKDVLYLVSSEHLKDVQIDNGEAYISGLTELPLRINGFNIQLTEETSLDERYKFQKTLTLSMHGYVNYKIFGGRYYAIVEAEDGTFYMVNVDFPARITHTFNLSQNTNQTDFTFASLSNFPTLKLNAEFEAVSPVCLGLNVYGIDKLELIEKEKARLDTVNRTVVSTEDFKKVEFLGNSCTFQEVYDGNKVTDTITFDIAFDNYKPSWHWNLLEFLDNRYSAIITPIGNDNKYYPGFNFGLEPSYTIQTASQAGQSDVITVTLKETSSYGTTAAVDWDEDQSTETRWRWVKRVGDTVCFECIGLGRARYLVKQEVDYFGNPTGNYQVMEGYESQYPVFHIVGTFATEEIFETTECSEDESCHIESTLPTTIYFNAITCNTYTLQASCDWEFTDVPNNITVEPMTGAANSSYTISICNTTEPTSTALENNMILKCCKTNRKINFKTQTDSGCIRPQRQYINCLSQDVQFAFDGECRIEITSIDPRLTYTIGNNTLTVRVPRNNETSAITWTIIAANCDCSSGSTTAYIIQDKTYERWIQQEGFICEDGNSYHLERRYTGTTLDNINVRTNETRKGTLIQSGDTRCGQAQTKWEWDGESYYCVNGNKLKTVFEWVSYDGINWVKTGNTRLGDLVEESSEWCNLPVTYSWVLTTQWACEETIKFRATYSVGDVYYVSCNSDSTLTTATTKPSAYQYSAMTTAEIGDCVTSIGGYAFYICSGLTRLNSSVDGVFNIPSGVTSIGQDAFSFCWGLTNVNIPSGVTRIEDGIFWNCENLNNVTFGNDVTYIGGGAFYQCRSLTRLNSSVDGVFNIPSGVTSIGNQAFGRCSGLTSITIPSGVTSIGNGTFDGCSSLTSITIPSGVTSIGEWAFSYCTSLPSITIPSGVTSIGNMAFYRCTSLTRLNSSVDGVFNIPSGITSIGDGTFGDCNRLTNINIPSGVTSIGQGAFYGCIRLTSITIPSGVTSINERTFQSCTVLTNVTIPSGVTSIGDYAFRGCNGFTNIDIPSGVTTIGQEAFRYCLGLTSVTVNAITPPTLGDIAFNDTNDCPIYVPSGSVNAYKNASGWSTYASRITAIPNS